MDKLIGRERSALRELELVKHMLNDSLQAWSNDIIKRFDEVGVLEAYDLEIAEDLVMKGYKKMGERENDTM